MRLGFIITKKVGTAVVRNRIRRRLRVAAKEVLLENCKPGYDIVIIGRGEALDIRFDRLKALILAGLGQLKLKKGEK